MTGRGGFFVALFAATGLHVVALGSFDLPAGSDGAGSGGARSLTLAIAGAEVAAMVETWESVPEVSGAPEAVEPPDVADTSSVETASLDRETIVRAPDVLAPTERPAPPLTTLAQSPDHLAAPVIDSGPAFEKAPDAPVTTPKIARLSDPSTSPAPALDTASPALPDFAVTTSTRPLSRPPQPVRQAVSQVAAGSADGRTRGAAVQTAVRTELSSTAHAAAQAAWAAAIQRKIARAQVYPRGARGDGRVRLAMTITAGGKLAGVRVATSSGLAAFDTAAVRAAKRAAPFPKAPDGLQEASFAFGQWVTFQR